MRKKIDRTSAVIGSAAAVGGIALGAIALGIPAIADAAGPSPSPQASSPAAPGHPDRGHHFGAESELTGATAAGVKAAVLAKLPGATVGRMSAEDPNEATGAAYEAHVTKSDGTRVEVLLDKNFKVTAVNADRHGRGHHFGAERELTDATAASVQAAVLAKLPRATVGRMSAEDPNEGTGAAYEAHVTKSDGTRVVVLLDKNFKVTAVNADRYGGRFGGHWRGGPPAGAPSTEAPSTGDSTSAAPTTGSTSA